MNATKEAVVGDSRYQIKRVSAEDGSYLVFQLLSTIRKLMQEDNSKDAEPEIAEELTPEQEKEKIESSLYGMIQVTLMEIDKKKFVEIQRYALAVCGKYDAVGEKEVVLPLLMGDGRVAIPALKNDISTLLALTVQSLHFNLLPFFSNGGFKTLMQ